MRLDKESVGTYGHRCTCDRFDHRGQSPGDSAGRVGLLQRVGDVHHHRVPERLHRGDAAHIDDQVVVTESRAAIGKQDVRVACVVHFAGRKSHRFGGKELSFLDVDHLPRLRGGYQQVGLAAEECRDLQYVGVLRRYRRFFRVVDVGYGRYAEFAAHFVQQFQRFLVADAAERVQARAVCFAVRSFEDVGDLQCVGHGTGLFGHTHHHLFVFDHAGAGHHEEHPAAEMLQVGNMVQDRVHRISD